MDYGTLSAVAFPAISWAIYVERRLSKIDSIKDKVDSTDAKVERLVEHLLPPYDRVRSYEGRGKAR